MPLFSVVSVIIISYQFALSLSPVNWNDQKQPNQPEQPNQLKQVKHNKNEDWKKKKGERVEHSLKKKNIIHLFVVIIIIFIIIIFVMLMSFEQKSVAGHTF